MAFRFLDLPTELRVMVYECIEPVTRQHSFSLVEDTISEDKPSVPLSILTKQTIGTSILATCSAIHAEAHPVLLKKLINIAQHPLRLQMDMDGFPDDSMILRWMENLDQVDDILALCRGHWARITQEPRTPEYPRHVEIALTSGGSIFKDFQSSIKLWHRICLTTRSVGGTCTVYHKGVLPYVAFGNQTVILGMDFWNGVKTVLSRANDPEEELEEDDEEEEEQSGDDILKIEELKDEDWDQLVDKWKTG